MKPTPTPASGTRRSVSVKKMHGYFANGQIQEIRETPAGAYNAMLDVGGSDEDCCQPCHIVVGYTGSAARLKRLAEIAAMDESTLLAMIRLALASMHDGAIHHDQHPELLRLLGLSPKNSKKAGRKL